MNNNLLTDLPNTKSMSILYFITGCAMTDKLPTYVNNCSLIDLSNTESMNILYFLQDGRLQINDQLLEVNNNSLIDLPNTESMDILRKAMQEEGPVPGCINIKVARRIGAPSPFSQTSPGVFDFTDSFEESPRMQNGGDSANSSEQHTPDKYHKPLANGSDFKSPNLFLERVLAGDGLRNESYTRATHESYVESPEAGQRKTVQSEVGTGHCYI